MSRKSRLEAKQRIAQAIINGINSQPPEIQHKLMWQWFFIKITFGFFVLIYIATHVLTYYSDKVITKQVIESSWFVDLTFTILCVMALLLFLLREKLKYIYGAIEVYFAINIIYKAVEQIKNQGAFAWIVAVTAVYVLVRGLDNLVSGYKNPPPLK